MKRNRDFEKEKEILKRQQKHTENTEENNFSYEMENEKIESLYVTREMAEDKEMDEKIRQDLIRAADEAEKASQEEEALGTSIPMGAEEKQQLFNDIVNELKRKGIWEEDPEEADGNRPEKGTSHCPARPEDQLSAEDQEALRLGRELLHTPKKKNPTILSKILKGITGAAVVALGVFVLSMSSEANREKIASVWNSFLNESWSINLEKGDSHFVKNTEIEEMYSDIKDKLNINPIELFYMPNDMSYKNYMIDEGAGIANVFYTYKNTTVTINMYKQNDEASRNQKFDGKIIDEMLIFPQEVEVNIYALNGSRKGNFSAIFNYEEACYLIWGEVPENEFKKIIKEIKFYFNE